MAFNKVILVGNIVADPELKTTTNGVSVIRFKIAVNRRFRSGDQQQTDFFNVVAWRQTAEFISRFFTKGKPILVSGVLQNRNWTDNNNVKHYDTEIVVEEATFVETRNGGQVSDSEQSISPYSAPSGNEGYEELGDDDEIPF